MKQIGVMGGAFNPIHSRHLMVAQAAVDQLGLEKVYMVPSGEPPHKKAGLLDKQARFDMVAAACAENPRFEASRLEIDRVGPTWTIDTFIELKKLLGEDVRLNFIIGEDNLPVLRDYERRAEFLALCRLVVSPRATCDREALTRWQDVLPEADIFILDVPANEVSSTMIRQWIGQGRSVRYLVHPRVFTLLKKKKHYAPVVARKRRGKAK